MMGEHEADYGFLEVWVDYIEDLDNAFVRELAARWGERLVVVFRRQKLEPMRLAPQRRLELLILLDGTPVLVDFDVNMQAEELAALSDRDLKLQVVASYHNYQTTPGDQELRKIVTGMDRWTPAIYKLSTMCGSEADAVRLLSLLLELRQAGKRYIVLGMGKAGTVTRIFGTLWGNELVFAPEKLAEQSAPGQLTRAQMDKIMTVLKG